MLNKIVIFFAGLSFFGTVCAMEVEMGQQEEDIVIQTLSKKDAGKLLKAHQNGSYILRHSQNNKDCIGFSFKVNNEICHTLIKKIGYEYQYMGENKKYSSIRNMINRYKGKLNHQVIKSFAKN